jgi:hypothetical protein
MIVTSSTCRWHTGFNLLVMIILLNDLRCLSFDSDHKLQSCAVQERSFQSESGNFALVCMRTCLSLHHITLHTVSRV